MYDPVLVRAALLDLTVTLGQRIRGRDQIARKVTLTVRFADGSTIGRTRALAQPSAHTDDLRVVVFRILDSLGFQRARIRRLVLTAEGLRPAGEGPGTQISLDPARENRLTLEPVVDQINARYGRRLAGPAPADEADEQAAAYAAGRRPVRSWSGSSRHSPLAYVRNRLRVAIAPGQGVCLRPLRTARDGREERGPDMWEPDGAEGPVGKVGVLLDDGSVPGPVYIDMGSGGHVPGFTDWWLYNGPGRRPLASRMRAVCECGWSGAATYPIDWTRVEENEPHRYDTSGPEQDRESHTRDVVAGAVPVPEDVAHLISQLRQRLDEIEASDTLTVLRIVAELDSIVDTEGSYAAREARLTHTDQEIAAALGSTEKAATARLRRYARHRYI